ncbi:PLP-dependent aminotransferase family protein [Conexibacter sp. SYSU D00693]|uniref:aminotransferase-like domain-containing protein n=1 Tax=Conexibacter sp. SYSU D00693 TaxID=2812560 RepID=UPI00196B5D40|nr:PLP-dependent aminotransferase family protein [Conexibacter sp. SYSU D00693]
MGLDARASAVPPAPVASRLAGVRSSPVRDLLALTRRPDVVSFAGGLPAPETFDCDGLREAFAAALEHRATLQYGTTEGDPELRALLAARTTARGVPCHPDDVLVTAGSQQGLTLLATVLLEPGDAVLVEDPAYLAALQAFGLAGARLVPVATDDDGADPDAVLAAAEATGAKALYLVPTFQNPTGRTLPLERRAALLQAAERAGLWVLEDDPYGELRLDGEPVPAIASLPGADERVVLLGSLSKVLAPGLRIGWLRAPAGLRAALAVAKQAADLHTATVTQAAATQWLLANDLDAHLERVRTVYRERRDALLAGLPGALPAGSTWTRPAGGMFCWVRLPDGADAQALLPAALEHGVAFVPGVPFHAGEPDARTMRLSYSEPDPGRIAVGLERLARALA